MSEKLMRNFTSSTIGNMLFSRNNNRYIKPFNSSDKRIDKSQKKTPLKEMKIYAISLMAFSPMVEADKPGGPGTYIEHLPGLQPAESIEQAAELARAVALERWKPADGWYSHQAAIEPVTKKFYDAAFDARGAGIVDMENDELPRAFNFS